LLCSLGAAAPGKLPGKIISSIHINLPTPSIILLSLLFLLFTTTSFSLLVNKKLLIYVSLMFLLPSILLIILFFFITYLLGLVLMIQLFLGLLLIYLLEALSFLPTLLPLQLLPFVKVFPKDQFLDLSYSYSILLLSVLLSLIRLSVIIYLLLTLNCSSPSEQRNSPPIFYKNKIQLISSLNGCVQIFSRSINQSKTELLFIGLPAQLSKISDPSLLMPSNITIAPAQSARNLGNIFDSTLSMSDHISSVSKSCLLSTRDLRRIRNTLDFSTARTIATSLIHSKLDYCNSLFLNLPQSQLGRLQLILNSSALDVSKTPKFAHISPVLKSLHWLKIVQRIQYKVASITYKVLQSEQPSYLHSLLNVQSYRSTRSSVIIILQRPSVRSRLKITTGLLPSMFLYFGILHPNNFASLRRVYLTALLQFLLHLPCPRISFTLNSKLFEQFFPPQSCLHQPFSVLWPLDLAIVCISQSFSLCRSFSPRSSTPVSVNKPPSVLALGWLYTGTLNILTGRDSQWSVGQFLLLLLTFEIKILIESEKLFRYQSNHGQLV